LYYAVTARKWQLQKGGRVGWTGTMWIVVSEMDFEVDMDLRIQEINLWGVRIWGVRQKYLGITNKSKSSNVPMFK
jgi:hypothetical protein